MSKIRNTGILSLYLAELVNAQQKNLKTFAALVYGHVYIIWSKKNHRFFMILAWACPFNDFSDLTLSAIYRKLSVTGSVWLVVP